MESQSPTWPCTSPLASLWYASSAEWKNDLRRLFDEFSLVWPLNLKCFYSFSQLWICSFRVGRSWLKGPRTRSLQLADKKMMSCLYLCVCVRFLCLMSRLRNCSLRWNFWRSLWAGAIQRYHAWSFLWLKAPLEALTRKTPQYLQINCISADLLASRLTSEKEKKRFKEAFKESLVKVPLKVENLQRYLRKEALKVEIFEGTWKDLRRNLRPSKVLVDHFRRYLRASIRTSCQVWRCASSHFCSLQLSNDKMKPFLRWLKALPQVRPCCCYTPIQSATEWNSVHTAHMSNLVM